MNRLSTWRDRFGGYPEPAAPRLNKRLFAVWPDGDATALRERDLVVVRNYYRTDMIWEEWS